MGETIVCNKHYEEYDIYVGRGSKWGNPYSHKEGTKAKFVMESREESINEYRKYLLGSDELMGSLYELRGKKLGCYCKPQSCHADILAELCDSSEYVKILCCGGRGYEGYLQVTRALRYYYDRFKYIVVVEGGARGADTLCRVVARSMGMNVLTYQADWNTYGKRAGVIRNQVMLDDNPDIDVCLAFPDENSIGTYDMINKAKKAGIETYVY